MSLFFSRVSKLTARRKNSRFFSSLPQFPCLLLPFETLRESPEGKFVYHKILDASKEKIVRSKGKKVPKELHGQIFLGASQGWVVSLNTKDRSLHLSDLYKPWVSSPSEVISLPSLGGLTPSTNAATKVSLSSSDPVQDKDLCVAAKFNSHSLSVCKPRCDSKWTHIEAPISPASEIMYSKRDKAFYFTSSSKDLYLGSLDLSNDNKLKYYDLRLRNQPKIQDGMVDECIMSKHLVEAPSGELLFIKCYRKRINKEEGEPKQFMVFREDETSKEFCYTEDIGDLCIFLGMSESSCLLARMYPGLKPNSIYYIGRGVGSYDLASGTICHFRPLDHPWLVGALYWLHPTDCIHAKGTEKGTDEGITFLAEEVVEERQEHFLEKEHQELFLEKEVHEKFTTNKFSSQGLEEEEVVEKRQELFLEKADQELFLEKADQELFLEKEEQVVEKPQEPFLEKEVHEKVTTAKFSSQGLEEEEVVEKPQELFLEKEVVEKPQEPFLEKEVHEKVTTKKFSNQGFEKEEVHSKTTTKKFNNQGLEEEEVHSKISTKKFSSQGLEEEEVVERTTRKLR